MDVGAAFPADGQPSELVEKGQGLFDDPADGLDVVAAAAARDVGGDAALTQVFAHAGVVVAFVRDQGADLVPWSAAPAS